MPQSANTMVLGGPGAAIIRPYVNTNELGTSTKYWAKIYGDKNLAYATSTSFSGSTANNYPTAPSYSFIEETDMGIYRSGNSQLGIATGGAALSLTNTSDSGGVFVMHLFPAHSTQDGTGENTPWVQIGTIPGSVTDGSGTRAKRALNLVNSYYFEAGAGTAAAPSIQFVDDVGTGFYRYGEDDIGITANGDIQAVISGQYYFAGDGDSFGGGYTFLNDSDTYITNPSANRIDIYTNNAINATLTQDGGGHGSIYLGDYDGFGGAYAFSNDTNTYITNPSADLMRIVAGAEVAAEFREAGGSVSVGMAGAFNATYNFIVNGSAAKTTAGTVWTSTSDDRLKQDIASITNATTTLKTLDPISYKWKDSWKNATNGESYALHGFVASDYESTFADFVDTTDIKLIQKADNSYRTGDTVESGETAVYEDLKFINTDSLVPHLVAAIKELDARIASLEGG